MLTQVQQKFLKDCVTAAKAAGHIFPEMAAAESALESSYGISRLARVANNLFGRKISHGYKGETVTIPTNEYINGELVTVPATWVKFPTVEACFVDRMELLKSLSAQYPHYAAALAANTPEDFVIEVSKSWSTDKERASKCISIYHLHKDILFT